MSAAFDDASVFQYQNLVGIADGAEAVCDDETCATAHESLESLLDQSLGGGVDTGGGLVENEDGRVLQQRAGDADALLFADAQTHPAFADLGVEAVGQFANKVMAICSPGGLKISSSEASRFP